MTKTRTATGAAVLSSVGVSPDLAVRVRGLRRTYGRGASAYEAVRGVDLDVAAGSITALLGTNGAGKTSTLEVLEGLARASAGEVRVLGLDPITDRAVLRARMGILLQRSGFSGDLTVRETLRLWHGTVSSPRPVDDMLELLSLQQRADVRMVALSGGETRRVDLASTLMGNPELAILDEPTTGLDPESRREVWRLVSGLREGGATVLITTHYLEEAEALADRLAIMHAGRIVRSGTPAEIEAGFPSKVSFADITDTTSAPGGPGGRGGFLGALPGVRRVVSGQGRTTLETDALQATLSGLLGWATRNDIQLNGLDARSPSLETVFLSIADGRGPADTNPGGALTYEDRPTHEEVGASR